jgi:hypothetical protein
LNDSLSNKAATEGKIVSKDQLFSYAERFNWSYTRSQ